MKNSQFAWSLICSLGLVTARIDA